MFVKMLKLKNALKKIYGLKFKTNFEMKSITSFKIGGKAKIFIEPSNLEHFIKVYHLLSDLKIPYVVLGNCTNVLISDKGFEGAVIKIGNEFSNFEIHDNLIIARSGALLNKIISVACKNNLQGMEEGFGIPGTIGGAVYMNASAYSFEMAGVVKSVLAMVDGKIKEFSNAECEFGYRKSVFQKLTNVIILEVEFDLKKVVNVNLFEIALATMKKRRESQPLNTFNAGSIFKKVGNESAGKIIDELGLKSFSCGGAKISEKHANFIENYNNATFNDVMVLIDFIKKYVKVNKDINLETEIKVIGEEKWF